MGKLYLYESIADTDLHFHFHVLLWVKFDEHLYFSRAETKRFLNIFEISKKNVMFEYDVGFLNIFWI